MVQTGHMICIAHSATASFATMYPFILLLAGVREDPEVASERVDCMQDTQPLGSDQKEYIIPFGPLLGSANTAPQ